MSYGARVAKLGVKRYGQNVVAFRTNGADDTAGVCNALIDKQEQYIDTSIKSR